MNTESKPTGRTFVIRTVNDFLDVPPDRIGQLLFEFGRFLYAIAAAEKAMDKQFGPGKIPMVVPEFRWTDDGIASLSPVVEVVTGQPPAEDVKP